MNRLLIIVAVASVCQLVDSTPKTIKSHCLEDFRRTKSDFLPNLISNTSYNDVSYTATNLKRPHVAFKLGKQYLDLFRVLKLTVTFHKIKKVKVLYQTTDEGREKDPIEVTEPSADEEQTISFKVPDYLCNKIVIKAICRYKKEGEPCSFTVNEMNACALCTKDVAEADLDDPITANTTVNENDYTWVAKRDGNRLAATFSLHTRELFRLRTLNLRYPGNTESDTSFVYDGIYKTEMEFEEKGNALKFVWNPLNVSDKLEIGADCSATSDKKPCELKVTSLEYCKVCPGTTLKNLTDLKYFIINGVTTDEPYRYKVNVNDINDKRTRVAFKLRDPAFYRHFIVTRLLVKFDDLKVGKALYVEGSNFPNAMKQFTEVHKGETTDDGLIFQFSAGDFKTYDRVTVVARCNMTEDQEPIKGCGFKILALEVCAFPKECTDMKKEDITSIALRDGAKAAKGKLSYELSDVVNDTRLDNRVRVAFQFDNKESFTVQELQVKFSDGRVAKSVSVYNNDFAGKEIKKETIESTSDIIKFDKNPDMKANKLVIETRCKRIDGKAVNCGFKVQKMDLCKYES